MSQLEIYSPKEFCDAIRFAAKSGQIDSFIDTLDRLVNTPVDRTVTLGKDFEPYSFGFSVQDARGLSFNGGFIYHGPLHDGKMGGCSSIQLCPKDGWSLHT